MQRVRITVDHNPTDPAEDLRKAAQVRRDLWAHSPVEIDPNAAAHGTHRDRDRNAYFEFATDYPGEVRRVLRDFGHEIYARIEVIAEGRGSECLNCGNISPTPEAVCSNCGFRDIDCCPYCGRPIARLDYLSVGGDVFKCPECLHRVRFRFNEPLFDSRGYYHQPVVLVSRAEALAHGL